jgi:hypothetical protein
MACCLVSCLLPPQPLGTAGAVLEPGLAFRDEASQPPVRGLAGHSGGLGRLRDPPAELADPMNQEPAQGRRQLRVSMQMHLWGLL